MNRAQPGRAPFIEPKRGRDAGSNSLNSVPLQDHGDVDHQGPEHGSGHDTENDPSHPIGFSFHVPSPRRHCANVVGEKRELNQTFIGGGYRVRAARAEVSQSQRD